MKIDILILRKTLIALGVSENYLEHLVDTEKEFDIKIMLVDEYLREPEVQARINEHMREFH